MSRYRKSWTEALQEIRENVPVNKDIDEAVLVDRDYKYDGKVIHISKKNFKKVHKDFKNDTPGKERMMTYDDKAGTVSVPVKFTESKQVKKSETDVEWHFGHEFQGHDDQYVEETKEDEAYGGTKKKKKSQEILKSKGYFHRKDRPAGWVEDSKEEVELDEKATAYPATVDTLKMIVKNKQHQTVMFDKGSAKVDLFTASAMLAVYKALKQPHLKKKFEDMIKSKEGFKQTQAFAMKVTK